VLNAVESYISMRSSGILELAAGSGKAASLWAEQLAQRGSNTKVVLTDLQPNVPAWQRLSAESQGRLSFEPQSVDATQVPEQLAAEASLRTIHLALHHFPPALVREILADIVRSGGALLVGDSAPNAQNLVMLNVVGFFTQAKALRSRPLHHMLLMPFVGVHDGVVSVLRSYSPEDLKELAEGLPGGEHYEWQFFYSYSGLSVLLGPKAEKLGAAPLLQWSFFAPRVDAVVDEPTPAVVADVAVVEEPTPVVVEDLDV
jgi:SAM-dependent methyltransferase